MKKYKPSNTEKFLKRVIKKTINFKKSHKGIIITNDEKGNFSVIMYKAECQRKMEEVFSDRNTYHETRYSYIDTRILTNIPSKCKLSVKNSYIFHEFITNTKLHTNDNIYSLDVTSLDTNVDITLSTDAILEKWKEIEEYTKIDNETLKMLVKFCVQDQIFSNLTENSTKKIRPIYGQSSLWSVG
jgi:hypothetical protein